MLKSKKRFTSVRLFLSLLENNDVVIIAGKGLCEEAYRYDNDGYFYIEDSKGIAASVALGIAMNTDKRVFILCDDYDFLKEAGAAIQMAVSKCANVYYVLFIDGRYVDDGNSPTIFEGISSVEGMFFNSGFGVDMYDDYFNKGGSLKELEGILDKTKGPNLITLRVGIGNKKFEEIPYSKVELKERIREFICNTDLGTSLDLSVPIQVF